MLPFLEISFDHEGCHSRVENTLIKQVLLFSQQVRAQLFDDAFDIFGRFYLFAPVVANGILCGLRLHCCKEVFPKSATDPLAVLEGDQQF